MVGIRDYVNKNGFPGVILGLSGGIDSALTAALAADALGPDRVTGVALPSAHSSPDSLAGAEALAEALGIRLLSVPIAGVVDAFEEALAGPFAGRPPDITEENLQARARGTLLMALSNKLGPLVLATGNKSEMSVGYSTLYGDMVGGFAPAARPLQDLGLPAQPLAQRLRGPRGHPRGDDRAPADGRAATRAARHGQPAPV